jgi:hypothetical protein
MNVNVAGSSSLEFDLPDGRYRVGSRSECEIHIDNSEVTGVAAQVEVRGEAVFIRNLNPFPIYVGDHELSSSQQAEWPQGNTVLLTQSVSLELFDVAGKSEQATAEQQAKRSRSTVQIAVTALCLGLGLFLLLSDKTPTDSTKALRYTFTDLVEELKADKTRKYDTVRNYLIDARVSDVRWGNENPRRAIAAYQLLLDEPLVRNSIASDETPQGRIRQFALARVDDLSGLLTQK